MASVIDSLVVTLGLDAKAFSTGIKGSASELATFTRRITGMFIAVRGLEDVVGYFKDLHKTLAQVGFESRNLGVAGTELKRFGEVSELFGGQMQDAAESVEGLQASIFGLKYKGQMSEQLIMLQRFGVAYLNAAGHMRSFRDIARDAAAAIDRQARVAGLDQGERYQLALSMGFTGGIASAVSQGGKGLEEALRTAQTDQRALTERTIKGQVQLDRSITRLQEATAANSGALLSTMTPAINRVTTELQALVNKWLPTIDADLKQVIAFFKNPPPAAQTAEHIALATGKALGVTGIEELATSILGRKFGFLAAGKEALQGHWANLLKIVGAMLLPEAGIAFAGDEVLKNKAPGLYNALDSWSNLWKAIQGMTGIATPGAKRSPLAGAGGLPLAFAGFGGTNVQIDTINVNTRATDANGIAQDMSGALRRKLLVSSADAGQQ